MAAFGASLLAVCPISASSVSAETSRCSTRLSLPLAFKEVTRGHSRIVCLRFELDDVGDSEEACSPYLA